MKKKFYEENYMPKYNKKSRWLQIPIFESVAFQYFTFRFNIPMVLVYCTYRCTATRAVNNLKTATVAQ